MKKRENLIEYFCEKPEEAIKRLTRILEYLKKENYGLAEWEATCQEDQLFRPDIKGLPSMIKKTKKRRLTKCYKTIESFSYFVPVLSHH